MNNLWIIAQAGEDAAEVVEAVPAGQQPTETGTIDTAGDLNPADANDLANTNGSQVSPLLRFLPFIFLFVIMYFMLFRGPRKQQQKHKEMVQTLSKNDKVRTIGGIIGTVVDIKDDEVVLKIDESNNTKIRVTAGAIGKNLTKE